jgi:hypothetical protein
LGTRDPHARASGPVPSDTRVIEGKAGEIKAEEIKAQEIKAQEIKAQEIKALEGKAEEIKGGIPWRRSC